MDALTIAGIAAAVGIAYMISRKGDNTTRNQDDEKILGDWRSRQYTQEEMDCNVDHAPPPEVSHAGWREIEAENSQWDHEGRRVS